MDKITKIQIENRSKWPISTCIQNVAHLVETESAFVVRSRGKGCTFRFHDGVNVGILPVSKAYPEDTLFFYIHNAE